MPDYLTLVDIAARTGSDAMIGLIEDVTQHAPEFQTLPVIPKAGTTYKATIRTALPTAAFRDVNEGVTTSKSTYVQKTHSMHFIDVQMELDQAIVKGDGGEVGDLQTNEASGAMRSAFNHIGSQIYYGTSNDAKGFPGLAGNIDSGLLLDATGSTAKSSVYFVWEDPQGVHLPIGNDGDLALGEWSLQRITRSSKSLMAWVNNFAGYIGLNMGSKNAAGRIYGLDDGSNKLTDALGHQLLSQFPVGVRPTRCFMNRRSMRQLQASRSAISNIQSDGGGAPFSPPPTHLAGVPIVVTDSITNSET